MRAAGKGALARRNAVAHAFLPNGIGKLGRCDILKKIQIYMVKIAWIGLNVWGGGQHLIDAEIDPVPDDI